jgi:acyl carrier protein
MSIFPGGVAERHCGGRPFGQYAIAASCFNISADELSLESTPFNTEGWDSVAHLNFILALEKSLGIELSPAEILNFESLADAQQIVDDHRGGLRS